MQESKGGEKERTGRDNQKTDWGDKGETKEEVRGKGGGQQGDGAGKGGGRKQRKGLLVGWFTARLLGCLGQGGAAEKKQAKEGWGKQHKNKGEKGGKGKKNDKEGNRLEGMGKKEASEKGWGPGRARERGGWDNRSKGRELRVGCSMEAFWAHWVASRILWGEVLVEVTERFGG